ncbi:carboxymuconolactone decarboxylase family protein [Nonomuraea sp. NPDC050663]|uniref:carboxymuconolactone decarboxylase family protein n=1 Tax=Nonomuraea sp. NPDC050663 TaxID=3364370 RepID=UPI0037B91B47
MRLPGLPPSELDPDQRAVYEAITGGPRAAGPRLFDLTDEAGRLLGPFNAMLLSPPLGAALQGLGAAIRYESHLPARSREIAILAVAAHWDSAFEWAAHVAVGRHAGLGDDELAAIRSGASPGDPAERLVLETVRALLTRSTLTDEEYDAAVGGLGERALFELTTLVGYYAMLALQLRVFSGEHPG